ncbi:aspartate-semialdehyde dehydrogenase [Erythrobacter crassostreae]|uniref:Aspartate-semialdehyde dehydrogenase n=1 Tax=Erythrobacter crassostreae TaxID=2828328 RepID=A0A9X1F4J8_9SPHN|nr:aspartate-semialdehyde dehydrogenase [Erythrobacter crassostrea]MBV7260131.1 aspartate-semialdehyde dehydrogenase [Erythrobacter crassostrea]
MRAFLIGFAALSLAACDSSNVPSPAERQAGAAPAIAPVDETLVSLRGDGLAAGAEAFYFAAGQNEVTTALSATLGAQTGGGPMLECGAGPMENASFPDGLTVNFKDGIFVGWFHNNGSDQIAVDGEFSIGAARSDVEALPGFALIEGSTLGEEFALGDRIGGLFEGDAVSTLYAGTQCFFR